MKRMVSRFFLPSLIAVALLWGGISCSTDDSYLSEFEVRRMIDEALKENNKKLEFTQWKIVNVQVKKEDWKWVDAASQWEVVVDLPELTKFIYENGAAIGYVFLGQQGKDEVQKIMPYVNTYAVEKNGQMFTFTETISCDFQIAPKSTVAFFIKDSELAKDENAPQNYNFRIVLIW